MKTIDEVSRIAVNDVIRQYPLSVELFNRYGIDACCGGAASVVDAADRDGADVDALLTELERIIEADG